MFTPRGSKGTEISAAPAHRGFHNESGSKITDGALSVNMKIPLKLKQKAGTPRGVEQKQRGLPPSLSSSQFSSLLKAQTWWPVTS